jgi:hypothetical protein
MNEPTYTRTTTIAGALLVLLITVNGSDLIKTIVLTTTGAVVSFVLSHLFRMLVNWWKTRKG